MTELRKILGSSSLSLLLVIWGLFMVCSGRVPDVAYEDDFMADDSEFQDDFDADNSQLMNQLAVLDDDESTKLEEHQRNEILEALGIESTGSEISRKEEDDFLNEELFLDLEVEIAELEKLNNQKNGVADSLRRELQDADYQLSALNRVVTDDGMQLASTKRIAPRAGTGSVDSPFAAEYQTALDDVYARRFSEAINKFRQLLASMDIRDGLADNCQYWIGEAYYAQGKFEQSISEFEKVFAFDNNNKADDAQFMIGIAYVKLGNSGMAQTELRNLMTFFQDSEYVARAQNELGDLNI